MQQVTVKADAVTEYLRSQGKTPEVAYFGNSKMVIGWRVTLAEFELVYRLEENQLVVCDFKAHHDTSSDNRAAAGFIKLIHQLERNVPQMKHVRGMLLDSIQSDVLSLRQRLAEVLVYQGAYWQEIDGDPWLVYDAGVKRKAAAA